jgi:hypothetical protein
MPGASIIKISEADLQGELNKIAKGEAYVLKAKYWAKYGQERIYLEKNKNSGTQIPLGYIELFKGLIVSILHLSNIDQDLQEKIAQILWRKYMWHAPSPGLKEFQKKELEAARSVAA